MPDTGPIDETGDQEEIPLKELRIEEQAVEKRAVEYQADDPLADETSFLLENQEHSQGLGNEAIFPWGSNHSVEATDGARVPVSLPNAKSHYKEFKLKTFKVKRLPLVNFNEFKLNPENYKRKSPFLMILQEGVSYLYDQRENAIVGKFDLNGQFFHRLYLQQFPPSILAMMKANQFERVINHPFVTKIRQERSSAYYYSNWV
ncbi:BA75_02938T0 [Komagataella pastoris]|uniref:BA75_02938T0 n=1 Tax=Komagataella pastoris TaxID=4922 RepID=A0A1B2JDY3_PICPA|nr:BA75_02938T0 [Komagataella pastoris]